ASIKRIIADEPSPAAQPQPAPSQPAAAPTSPDMQTRPAPNPNSAREPAPPWPRRDEPPPPDSILELTNRAPEKDTPRDPPATETSAPARAPLQKAVERLRQ